MEFEKRKARTLASMSSSVADKSPKGSLDTPIIPLINTINQHPSYFTTSSCSGRISILHQPHQLKPNTNNKKKKAGGGSWIFITHDPADSDSVVDLLFGRDNDEPSCPGDLVFRFEPLIVAVDCKDVSSAQELVSSAVSCGFRESGITNIHKRVMVAIRCSIRLEVPLGERGRIMVSPEYVRYLVGIANEKMEANRRRTDGFLQNLQCKGPQESTLVNIDSHQKQQCWLANQGTLLDLEAKQLDVLSEVTSLEKDALKGSGMQNLNCQHDDVYDNVQDNCDTKPVGLCTKVKGAEDSCKSLAKDLTHSNQLAVGDHCLERTNPDFHLGSSRAPECCLSAVKMTIVGEPVEKLFLWGQSACTLNNTHQKQIMVFGGFGGLGRHARRNDSLIVEPLSGMLKVINAKGPPSPRLGHTSSVVGECVFVIGGRGDPMQILNDVWVLNKDENEWKLIECTGSVFFPRHRHTAAVVGKKIYIFGGLNNETIYSCMHVLDTENLQWSEVSSQGEWPCARHSHSMVAEGSRLFMFGGYDGEQILGDLYSFDVGMFLWKKEKTMGTTPFARFSHSMFIYKCYLGIVGGCPVRQQCQEVALLDLRHFVWKHVTLYSISKDLLVRSTASVVEDDLVIIGGGASCYAFGTKFNEPMKINLRPLIFTEDNPFEMLHKSNIHYNELMENSSDASTGLKDNPSQTIFERSNLNNGKYGTDAIHREDGHHMGAKHWVLQLERKCAKQGKDILKKFGWLDFERKVYSSQDGLLISLPISEKSYAFFQKKLFHSVDIFDSLDGCHPPGPFPGNGFSINEASTTMALNILLAYGGSVLNDDKAIFRKSPKAPQKILREETRSLIKRKGMPLQLLEQLPTRWERLGDIVVLPATSFKDPIWDSITDELWPIVAKSLGAHRLARQGRILPTGTRDSTLEILVGDDGWVDHHENGILYSFDATKCMFSAGNLSEKLRMAQLDCREEIIVDLFAGIGYFVLPFLVKAKAKLVYACEWNPYAIEALRHNIQANFVADRCVILEGDNRVTAPKGVADRVCLGLLPISESSWVTAVRALRIEGGLLHVHGNVKDSEEDLWSEYVAKSIDSIAKFEGYCWDVSIEHLERVKWYGPHIRHLVADIRCKQLQR